MLLNTNIKYAPCQPSTSQGQTGRASNMLEQWKDENMRDQPFHAIEACKSTEKEKSAGSRVDRGSSVEYLDPNEETAGR
jgi:hypothetical protein